MKIKNLTGEDINLLDTSKKHIFIIPAEYTTSEVKNIVLEIETNGYPGIKQTFRIDCSNRFESKILKIGQFDPLPPPEKDTVFLITPNAFENAQYDPKEKDRKDICTYPYFVKKQDDKVVEQLIFN